MYPSKSLEMGPSKSGPGSMFFKSQLSKPVQTPKDIDLSGKVTIVTGASTGLGLESCRQFLSLKLSHLIMAVRSVQKGEKAAKKLRTEFPTTKIEVWTLEMSSYDSIQAFVHRVEKDLVRLDIVILNAGLAKQDLSVVESTGHEESIQVNYISTVLLSILILPALKAKSPPSTPGRLSIVSSGTVFAAKFPTRHEVPLLKTFDDKANWDANDRYATSKVLGHYFIVKMASYVDPSDVIINLVDPGLTKGSGLLREVTGLVSVVFALMKWALGRTLEVGASTYVDAAVVKENETHGSFLMDWKIAPFAYLLYAADSNAVTEQLWDESMKELEFCGALRALEGMRQ
ncbi:Short chain dehydrogenase [Hyphodiscus hymeniophilus]|uniref:Short chain dehydrogenase n=1 Tax=Hyphodiscus hymeniophilus TaxID=353542 RepID=A0A9P6VKD8_9HELO|nr:Short chain dehydrogenase [Hyphodiscus hymeniophilus]